MRCDAMLMLASRSFRHSLCITPIEPALLPIIESPDTHKRAYSKLVRSHFIIAILEDSNSMLSDRLICSHLFRNIMRKNYIATAIPKYFDRRLLISKKR